MGSRCLKCYVRARASRLGLRKYEWWLAKEQLFVLWLYGRSLNDDVGVESPSAEEMLRGLTMLAVVKQYRRLEQVKSIIDAVDTARRKRNAEHPNRTQAD